MNENNIVISDRLIAAADKVVAFFTVQPRDDLITTKMDNFDIYESIKKLYVRGKLVLSEEDAERMILGYIENHKDELALQKKRKEQVDRNFTGPKLLSRYLKLPDMWRIYVGTRFFDIQDSSDDESDAKECPDKKISTTLAELQTEYTNALIKKDDTVDEYRDFMDRFDLALKEAEEQVFV